MKKTRRLHTSAPRPESPESMAALAGGMADDFNNILTTVMGACSLIDSDDRANGELLQCVALIRTSAEHAAHLSGRLMHAGAMERGHACSGKPARDSGSGGTSVRDKNDDDDIVSTTENPGGAPS